MSVEFGKKTDDVKLRDIGDERRSIASIIMRKPSPEELRSCQTCRYICIGTFFIVLLALLATSIVLIVITVKCNHRIERTLSDIVVMQIDVTSYDDLQSTLHAYPRFGVNTLLLNGVIVNMNVNQAIGTRKELQQLLATMKREELSAVLSLDLVDVDDDWLANKPRDWFINNGTTVGINATRSKLNYGNENVVQMLKGKLKEWMLLGVKGFLLNSVSRLSIVGQSSKSNSSQQAISSTSHRLLQELCTSVKENGGFLWLAPNAGPQKTVTYLGTAEQPESDAVVLDTMATIRTPVNVTMLKETIQLSIAKKRGTHGSLAWINGGPGYQSIKSRFPVADAADLLVLFSLTLPGKIVSYYGMGEGEKREIDGFSELLKLRTARIEFMDALNVTIASDSKICMVYGSKVIVVVNFGAQSTTLNAGDRDSTVLFSNRGVGKKISLVDFQMKPHHIMVVEV